jgi:hypothetical protein
MRIGFFAVLTKEFLEIGLETDTGKARANQAFFKMYLAV